MVGPADPVVVELAGRRRCIEPVRHVHAIRLDAVRVDERAARSPVHIVGRFSGHIAPLQFDMINTGPVRGFEEQRHLRHIGRGNHRFDFRVPAGAAARTLRTHAVVVGHVFLQAGNCLGKAHHRQIIKARHKLRLYQRARDQNVVDGPDLLRCVIDNDDLKRQRVG